MPHRCQHQQPSNKAAAPASLRVQHSSSSRSRLGTGACQPWPSSKLLLKSPTDLSAAGRWGPACNHQAAAEHVLPAQQHTTLLLQQFYSWRFESAAGQLPFQSACRVLCKTTMRTMAASTLKHAAQPTCWSLLLHRSLWCVTLTLMMLTQQYMQQ